MSLNVNPEYYLVRHQLGVVASFNLNLQINYQGQWQMHNDPSMIFLLNGQNVPEVQGAGDGVVNLKLMNSINHWNAGFHTLKLRVFNFNTEGAEEKSITIFLMLTENEDDEIFPKSLIFEAVRNVKNALPQRIFVASNESSVSFTLPSFLELIDHEVIGGGHIIAVKPPHFPVTPEKHYTGSIVFSLTDETVQCPVHYQIHAGFDDSYLKSVHFSRDNSKLIFYQTTLEKSFLRLDTFIKTFQNNGELKKEFNLSFDLPFIEHKAEINIGAEIEPYFKLFENLNSIPQHNRINGAYPPMEVSMIASEVRYSDFKTINQDLIATQRYLRGRNPVSKISKPFWLAYRPNSLRYVSSESTIIIKLFKPAGEPVKKINVYLNGVYLRSIVVGTNCFNLMLPYFLHTSFDVSSVKNISVGDVLSFQYEGISTQRNFIVRPNQQYLYKVAFRTDWDTMDVIELTGPSSFELDYVHLTSKMLNKSNVEIVNKLATEKEQKLILNTGWLDKSEPYYIDELINSKKAFLLQNSFLRSAGENNYHSETYGNIELIPIQSKIKNHESDQNLISYDLEFIINKRYEDEIYSR